MVAFVSLKNCATLLQLKVTQNPMDLKHLATIEKILKANRKRKEQNKLQHYLQEANRYNVSPGAFAVAEQAIADIKSECKTVTTAASLTEEQLSATHTEELKKTAVYEEAKATIDSKFRKLDSQLAECAEECDELPERQDKQLNMLANKLLDINKHITRAANERIYSSHL